MCECSLLECVFLQADRTAAEADMAVEDVEKTHKRAKDMESEIQNLLKKIQGREKHKFSGSTIWFLLSVI